MPAKLFPMPKQPFSEALEQDKDSSSPTIKQQAGDAANRWLERNRNLVLRQTPVWAQSLAVLLASLGTIAVVGGFIFKIDEVVSVNGQLKSVGGTVEVKTPAGGRVAKVLFKDGELVEKGQLLMIFDTREAMEEKVSMTDLISLEEKELNSRLETIDSQKIVIEGRLEVFKQKLETKSSIVAELGKLVDVGGFQQLKYLEQKDELLELRKKISEVREQQGQLKLQSDQTRLEAQKNINQMKSRLKTAELQLQYQNVLAPTTGIVFDPKASQEGVLESGERILSIVPQGNLFAEVFVPNTDIGFVQSGQMAKIRVDAFPFTRYGELVGKVTQIAADSLPPDSSNSFYRFPLKMSLNRSFLESKGAKIPLQAGMSITANLKLREKRVISLVSDIFVDQTDSIKSLRQQ